MIEIYRNGYALPFESFNFPAGEVGFKLAIKNNTSYVCKTNFFSDKVDVPVIITAKINSSNDIMQLVMAADAIRNIIDSKIYLFLPYMPYSRQDRVCDSGEAFSLRAFANLINSLNFDKVFTIDPHSEITNAVFNKLKVVSQLDLIAYFFSDFRNEVSIKGHFISPDAGANKKTSSIAAFFSHSNFVRADKLRDLSNGNIKETIVYKDNFEGADVYCCDDICDGGRTFTELAKVCKAKNCGRFILFVSHGIFSKGVDTLLNNGIDKIFTTDSMNNLIGNDKVVVLPICNSSIVWPKFI